MNGFDVSLHVDRLCESEKMNKRFIKYFMPFQIFLMMQFHIKGHATEVVTQGFGNFLRAFLYDLTMGEISDIIYAQPLYKNRNF